MSTVAVREDTQPAAAVGGVAVPEHLQSLAEWAQQLDAAMRIASALAATTFVPKAFRGKPEECAAAILTGHDLGLTPMSALRAIYPVDGRIEMYAGAMKALVISHGHDIWVEEQSEARVVVCGVRKGTDRVQKVVWDPARIEKAGLSKKDNHVHYGQQMMVARGTAEMCRLIAPDVLHGIYAVEEEAGEPIRTTAVVGTLDTPALTGADILAQAAMAPPTPAPAVQEPERVAPKAGDAALKRMFALMAQHGLGGRDQREKALTWISQAIGRDITTRDDLTAGEVKHVCDVLEQMQPAEPGPAEPSAEPEPESGQ